MNTRSLRTTTVLVAESTSMYFGGAARVDTHSPRTTIVLNAESSSMCVGDTPWHRAQPVNTVFGAELRLVQSHGGAVFCQAHPIRTVGDAHASRFFPLSTVGALACPSS